ncbi:MAG: ABC transporter ATP-binding protein [Desulfonatronovibrio sp.]
MLEGRNLAFGYNNQNWLFQDLNIRISAGDKVGLPGPSGGGKSTLARILAGYLVPTHGEVTVDGRTLEAGAFNPVQLIFQHPELAVNPRWRIKDILCEAGRPPEDLLEKLQIDRAWRERYPYELSGGELQRVCLVRALDTRTRYLLCDEITSMLDALTQASIWKNVLEIVDSRDMGMLVISHDESLLARICDRTEEYFAE